MALRSQTKVRWLQDEWLGVTGARCPHRMESKLMAGNQTPELGRIISRGFENRAHLRGFDLIGTTTEIAHDFLALILLDEFRQFSLVEQ